MLPRRLLVPLGTAAFIAVAPAAAAASWSATGTGSARATAGTLGAPAAVSAAGATTTTVKVTVSAGPASPSATPTGYRVDRTAPSALVGACFITGTTGSCDAAASGTGSNTYRVYSWIGPSSAAPGWVSGPSTTASATPVLDAYKVTLTGSGNTANPWVGTVNVSVKNGATNLGSYKVAGVWNGRDTVNVAGDCTTSAAGTCSLTKAFNNGDGNTASFQVTSVTNTAVGGTTLPEASDSHNYIQVGKGSSGASGERH